MPLNTSINNLKAKFEEVFDHFITKKYDKTTLLTESCSYSLEGKGKRIRALLVMLCNKALGGNLENAFPAAIAVEVLHTYSLIHDDLPCLDNDEIRRGRPTVHIEFDEPIALLTGDALLADAFQLLSDPSQIQNKQLSLSPEQKLFMIQELSLAAGSSGMVLGQMMDVHWTARKGATQEDLDSVHINKTGKLIASACSMGGISAGAHKNEIEIFREFGIHLGLAFQVIDDLLDDSKAMGKSIGKDKIQEKLTYLSLMSREDAEEKAKNYTEYALNLVKPFGDQAEDLICLAETLLTRQK